MKLTFKHQATLFAWLLTVCPWRGSTASAAMTYIGKDRPAALKLPANYDPSRSYPLLVLLHGYASDAAETTGYLEADLVQQKYDVIVLAPNGTVDENGFRHWNASPVQKPDAVDDSTYIQGLIATTRERFNVDGKQIYVMGISNGGFMAYRLACDTNGLFAGVVSIAGSMFADTAQCRSTTPVSLLEIHGTADELVPFQQAQGASNLGAYESAETWAKRNECQKFNEQKLSLDLILQPVIPGISLGGGAYQIPEGAIISDDQKAKDSDALLWTECKNSVKVGLWRVKGGSHVPDFTGKNLVGQALEFFR